MTIPLRTSYCGGYRPEYGVAVRTRVGSPRWWKGESDHIRRIAPYAVLGQAEGAEYERLYLANSTSSTWTLSLRRFAQISGRHDNRPLVLMCFEKDPADCHARGWPAGWRPTAAAPCLRRVSTLRRPHNLRSTRRSRD